VITTLGLTVLAVAVFAWYAPRRAQALPPRTATYLLTGGALIVTGLMIGVLALAASTAVAQLPPVARAGQLSRPQLRSTDPVPVWLALCCCALVIAGLIRCGHQTVRRALAYARMHRDCRDITAAGADQPVILLDSEQPEAYATPAGGGRIVVTTGLLAALSPDEQRVLLAHEAAHLRYRHVWCVLVVDVCTQANPMLRGVARATTQATERWADEYAAALVGDRELAARAVARAALHISRSSSGRRSPYPVGLPRTAAIGGQVPQRVRALLAPPPRPRLVLTAGLILLLVAGLGCAVSMQRRADTFFDLASFDAASSSVGTPAVQALALAIVDTRPASPG
jgi:Zn-dependent protease with chaperone function